MGPTAAVYVRRELSRTDLVNLDAHLETASTRVEGSRKLQAWDIWITPETPIHIAVSRVHEQPELHEDELLDLGLLPDDVVTCIGLSAARNRPVDWEKLASLATAIGRLFDGVVTNPG